MEIKEKQKKKIFFFFKNKNNLLSKKLTTKRIKYDIFIDIKYDFSIIHDKIKNILIFNGKHPSNFIQEDKSYKKLGNINVSNIKKISSGDDHTLILTKDNKLYAFGVNKDGRCGVDPYQYPVINLPMEIKYFKNIIDISCSDGESFILLENGELYFFGIWADTHIPQKIKTPHKIIKILSSGHSSYIMILDETKNIYKFEHNDLIQYFPTPSRLFDDDIIGIFLGDNDKNFILSKNNTIYEEKIRVPFSFSKDPEDSILFVKHNIPSFIKMEHGEHIIKIFSDNYKTIYLTNKSIYVDRRLYDSFFKDDNDINQYEIKFFRNKNIINFATIMFKTILALSKDGTVYGIGLNNENKEAVYKYDSPIILYSS